jgi:phosphatidylserine/phosphatidylglycerophosphate/cardiolipin synthase-like enzyme
MAFAMIARFRISPSWSFVLPAALLGMAIEHRSGAVEPPCPIGAAAEVHYGPGEDLERIDVALLREAAKQIDMAAYVLTDRSVIEALREAAARGVTVRIWRDANMAERVGDVDVEAQLGGRVQGLEIRSKAPSGELMHLKGLLRRSSPVAHRLGQFQPVGRNPPGQ